MTVESAQYITQINSDFPENSATISKNLAQHINLTKNVIVNVFGKYNQEVTYYDPKLNNVAGLTANLQSQINTISNNRLSASASLRGDIVSTSASLNASLLNNNETAVNTTQLGARHIYVQTATPSTAIEGDVWFRL